MATSAPVILQTKLTPPPVRVDRVHRPRLAKQFSAGAAQRLTLVCAPAGYGKSTLLSEWFRSETAMPMSFGWLSLDEDDNDPVRFLIYLISAFTNASGLDTGDILTLLHSPQPPPPKTLLMILISRLESVPRQIALALDDYHLITKQAIHDAMIYLLDHLPAHVFIAITSREDPPLPLARFRGRGQLSEIRAVDLRFTLEEIEQFLWQMLATKLTSAQFRDLEHRTEGWVVGLQLAALAMKDRQDIDRFVTAFTGSHRYILDYLTDEVLSRQPEATRTFLLRTSILNRLSGPLCDSVTSSSDGRLQLEHLERNNLFLIPLDDQGYWFRYHHLFGDMLKHQLMQATPDLVSELHQRASRWFAAEGLIDEAVSHALAAKDFEMAASILENSGSRYFLEGWGNFGTHWVMQLPFEVMQRHILLSLNTGMWHSYRGEGQLALKYVEAARSTLATAEKLPAETEELLGYADTIEALAASLTNDIERASKTAASALQRLPRDQYRLRTSALLVQGFIYQRQLKLDAAREAYVQVIEAGQVMNDVTVVIRAMVHTGDSYMIEGRLHDAEVAYQRCIQLAQQARMEQVTSVANAYAVLGCVQLEQNRLAEAAQSALRCIEHFELEQIVPYALLAQAVLARAADLMTDRKVFQRAVRSVHTLLETYPALPARVYVLYSARIWMVEELAPLFHRVVAEQRNNRTNLLEAHLLQLVRVREMLAQESDQVPGDVFAQLDRLTEHPGHNCSIARQVERLLLKVQALAFFGQRRLALETLAQALELAELEDFVRLFVDEGVWMWELLHEVRAHGISVDYVTRLLTAFNQDVSGKSRGHPRQHMNDDIEALSDRELEVLRLVADGASNREIAQQLVVSVGTVKRHLNNIFAKLDAQSRTQAIANAKKNNIL